MKVRILNIFWGGIWKSDASFDNSEFVFALAMGLLVWPVMVPFGLYDFFIRKVKAAQVKAR